MNLARTRMSLTKAYLIVGECMHRKHEVKSLGLTIVFPIFLLVWAIIAFMQEGGAWKSNRNLIDEKNRAVSEQSIQPEGMLLERNAIKE
jgi:hypothetical protein